MSIRIDSTSWSDMVATELDMPRMHALKLFVEQAAILTMVEMQATRVDRTAVLDQGGLINGALINGVQIN